MATPISPREKAWRTAELTSWLELVRLMINRERSFEDAIILWAVRKCEYEDKPATLAAIEALAGLSHSTVSQNCKRMRNDGRLLADKSKDGKRRVQKLHPDYAESAVVVRFYAEVRKIGDKLAKALAAADKLSDEVPSGL